MRRSIAPPGLKAGICGKVNAPRGKVGLIFLPETKDRDITDM
jgi:hypothetical protein